MANLPPIDYATNLAMVNAETGVVDNIVWGLFYSAEAYSKNGYIAIPIDDLCVHTGDIYRDGKFYDEDGEIILSVEEMYDKQLEGMDDFIVDELYHAILEETEDV